MQGQVDLLPSSSNDTGMVVRASKLLLKHRWKLVISLVLLASLIGGLRLFWESLAWDYLVLEDYWYGPGLQPVDEIEIILLKGTKHQAYIEGKIDEYESGGSKIVTGQEADKISEMWRFLPRNPRYAMMCYGPVYGLRFRERKKLILETAICWHCNQYSLYPALFGSYPEMAFDGQSKAAQMLLTELEKQVPMPVDKMSPHASPRSSSSPSSQPK